MMRSIEPLAGQIEVFDYPDSGEHPPNLWEDLPVAGALPEPSGTPISACDARSHGGNSNGKAVVAIAGDLEQRFQAGREQGIREGREEAQAAHLHRIREIETCRIAQSADLVNRLAQERDHLLSMVEQDVVELALAIAERVLRREAEMDPLFLVGAVRVALGQLAQTMRVRLRIPFAEAELWTETMAHMPNLRVKPEIVPDPAMRLGDCEIETEMGSADLSLAAQLHNIRHAFMDESQPGEDPNKLVKPSPHDETTL